jgi:(2Fe-2S) ferredoxin
VYPSGYWYLDIEKKDLNRIFNESVVSDKPVPELAVTFNKTEPE